MPFPEQPRGSVGKPMRFGSPVTNNRGPPLLALCTRPVVAALVAKTTGLPISRSPFRAGSSSLLRKYPVADRLVDERVEGDELAVGVVGEDIGTLVCLALHGDRSQNYDLVPLGDEVVRL